MPSPLAPLGTSALDAPRAPEPVDHGSLHGTVTRSMLGAGAGALVADLACRISGTSVETSKLFMLLVAAGAFAGVAFRGRRWLAGALGGGLGLLGSLASGLAAQWAPFSAALLGVSAAPVLGEGERPKRKLLTGIMAGAFGYAGLHVAEAILQAGLFAPLVPAPLAAAAAGASAGLFIGLATAPRFLVPEPDPIEEAFAAPLELRDGELHDLLVRALGSYRALRSEVEARGGDREARALEARVGQQVMRILRIAEHCRRVEGELAGGALERLEDRAAQLERKMGATMDPGARDTYAQALANLEAQREALTRLASGRERVVARLHVDVALLEKLQMSILQLHSADAERSGAESASVVEALEELGRELDATSQAIGEVFGRPVLGTGSAAPVGRRRD